ncbi:MAG: alpha/beta hydrolase [bacterium]
MKKIKRIGKVLVIVLIFLIILPYFLPLPHSKYASGIAAQKANATDYPGRFLEVAGKQIYVEELNPTAKQVITFIHGFGGSTFTWRDNQQFFADQGYRVVLIDTLGFGFSTTTASADYSHPAQAKLIKSVLDQLGITETILVGHSMGGNIVLHFTESNPQMVSRLVLVDALVVSKPSKLNIVSFFLTMPPLERWTKVFLNVIVSEKNFDKFLRSAYYDGSKVTPETIAGYHLSLEIKGWQSTLLGIASDNRKNAVPEDLATIHTPTLIIWGSGDTWIPLAQGQDLQKQIKDSKLVEIPDAGHLVMEEKSKEFNQVLWEGIEE